MNCLKIPIILICLILTGACGDKSNFIKPERKDITEVVYASGNLYPETEYKIIANLTGYLVDIMVGEGDTVKEGQALFAISESNRRSELETAAFALKVAEENAGAGSPVLAQLKEKMASARTKQANDSLTWTRYKRLLQSGAIAQADLDRVQTNYEASKRDNFALADQYRAQERSLKLELAQARNRFNLAKNNLGDVVITSQSNGIIYEINKQRGDFIHQNEAIALLGSGSQPLARLSIDEADLNQIKSGQEVLLSFDAWPDKIIKATIGRVFPKVNKAEQSFRADATILDSTFSGIYGMNLEANIIIRSVKNSLSIPRLALLSGDSVRIKRKGDLITVKVKTGAGDLSHIEIIQGLEENDEVLIAGLQP
jgi:HlyD family secretion protein